MRRYSLRVFISLFIVFSITGVFCVAGCLPASAQNAPGSTVAEGGKTAGKSKEEQEKIEAAKEKAREALTEAQAAKKEVEVQKKAVELEKEKAEVERKEAEIAKKEAEVIKETTRYGKEIEDAVKKAAMEEEEAAAALKKVTIAEEKMLAAQEKARLAAEEVMVARDRAAVAEAKIREKRNIFYAKLFQTGAILFFGYLLIFILVGIVNRRVKDIKAKHLVRKNIIYILTFLIILAMVFLWGENVESVTIFLSAVGAGVALALHEAILCIAGWVLILVRRPFEVGDRIELGGVKGDVIDIRLFQTTMLEIGNWVDADQSTGRIVNVPNSAVFKNENYNYNRGFEFIWNEIRILVTFESDWKKAEKIMMKHGAKEAEGMEEVVKKKIARMARRYMIYYEKLAPIVYINIKDSGVELSLRYLTEAKKRRFTQDELCRNILEDFGKQENVNFAYTTYRIVK